MGLLILATDFTSGKYTIAQGAPNAGQLDACITKYESKYLADLMGVELYTLFAATVSSHVPVGARYLNIFNPFQEQPYDCIIRSEGMKEMLKGFIYWEFVRDQPVKNTMNGNVIPQLENNEHAGPDAIYARYNEAIKTYRAIQWYCIEHDDVYPEFKGIDKGIAHWAL